MANHNSTSDWLSKNEQFFLPPVCNKMMHNDQLKVNQTGEITTKVTVSPQVFYVGGPNQRKDFHLEEGEEFFYMRKGSMSLPILTNGAIRTVHIRQGDVFLLPGRSAIFGLLL